MQDLKIYCFTLHEYTVLNKMPKYIKLLGLGKNNFSKEYLDEKKGLNINSLNEYYGEATGLYWIWKNELKQMDKKEDMYRELVWFARNNPPKGIRLKRWKRIIAEYPEETSALECSGESDWTNGFNSGCLASFRYAARVLKGQITVWGEDWDTDFPELDTYDFDA